MKRKKTEQEVADSMIKIMQDAGLTPDEMLEVIRMAREKYKQMKLNEN